MNNPNGAFCPVFYKCDFVTDEKEKTGYTTIKEKRSGGLHYDEIER